MLYLLGNIFLFAVTVGWGGAAWRLGDWRQWRKFYPTILFVISVDFFVSILTYEHPLWYFHRSVVTPNHTVADFFIALTNFPPMILVFLSHYPVKPPLLHQFAYVSAWALGNFVIETIFLYTGLMSYHNGWNLWWSVLFWFLMFVVVRLHSVKPLGAWLAILGLVIGGVFHFHIPVAHLK